VSSNVTAFSPPSSWGSRPSTRRKTLFIKIWEPSEWGRWLFKFLGGEIGDGSQTPFCPWYFKVKPHCAWSPGAPSVIYQITAFFSTFQLFCPFYIDLSMNRGRGKCHKILYGSHFTESS
jgi:hypothetical protein